MSIIQHHGQTFLESFIQQLPLPSVLAAIVLYQVFADEPVGFGEMPLIKG